METFIIQIYTLYDFQHKEEVQKAKSKYAEQLESLKGQICC